MTTNPDPSRRENGSPSREFRQPGAAAGDADAESGRAATSMTRAERDRQIQALSIMQRRGLIPDAIAEERKAALLALTLAED